MKPQLLEGAGQPEPRGATLRDEGVNFSVYSEAATRIFVCLFDEAGQETDRFELTERNGPVFFGFVGGIGAGARYGLRADGPYDPSKGLWFDPNKLLVDPYARQIDKAFVQDPELATAREASKDTANHVPKAVVVAPVTKPAEPMKIAPKFIYELNTRGFTKLRPDLPARLRGQVGALIEGTIPRHFADLGVDTIELMPVAAWIDDWHLPAKKLTNFWGYNPVPMMAPDPRLMPGGMEDLRKVTDFYRERGIAVVLDVVFNHTGEGDTNGPVISYRGLNANAYYYHQTDDAGRVHLLNDAGTGNTLDCQHPEVRRLLLDTLRYWVEAGGVSGFRFDLAAVLGRGPGGFSPDAPLLAAIKADPLLSRCILIAEPWDVGPGGYQLGAFGAPFLEWNDRYRDDIRAFWRGDSGLGAIGARLTGSSDIFQHRGRMPSASINFIAVHDGFTLRDLVTYARKHNMANGENNRDGHAHNLSWNCGYEGETEDADIVGRRWGDAMALLATLFLSRGTPMIQQGDEFWRSQGGNNNAYAQDNAITWVDWHRADKEMMAYVERLAAFRSAHPAVCDDAFLTGKVKARVRDVTWLHPAQREMTEADWHDDKAATIGMLLDVHDDEVMIWLNRSNSPVQVFCPLPRTGSSWRVGVSSVPTVGLKAGPGHWQLPPRSVVALVPNDEGTLHFA
jgi:glycogen operon protein